MGLVSCLRTQFLVRSHLIHHASRPSSGESMGKEERRAVNSVGPLLCRRFPLGQHFFPQRVSLFHGATVESSSLIAFVHSDFSLIGEVSVFPLCCARVLVPVAFRYGHEALGLGFMSRFTLELVLSNSPPVSSVAALVRKGKRRVAKSIRQKRVFRGTRVTLLSWRRFRLDIIFFPTESRWRARAYCCLTF